MYLRFKRRRCFKVYVCSFWHAFLFKTELCKNVLGYGVKIKCTVIDQNKLIIIYEHLNILNIEGWHVTCLSQASTTFTLTTRSIKFSVKSSNYKMTSVMAPRLLKLHTFWVIMKWWSQFIILFRRLAQVKGLC